MSHPAIPVNRALRIVLPGGSGQVGRMLAQYFQERGHHVTVLTRGPYTAPWLTVHWDGKQLGPWVEALEGADVCIHLSGRSVNCRYTARNRRELYESRIGPTRLLHEAFAGLDRPAAPLDERLDGHHLPPCAAGNGFDRQWTRQAARSAAMSRSRASRRAPEKWNWTVQLAKDWEAAFFGTPTPRTRKIALRTSLVFSPAPGSVFAVLSNLVRAGLGGTQGNGRQYVSWIHESDFARAWSF